MMICMTAGYPTCPLYFFTSSKATLGSASLLARARAAGQAVGHRPVMQPADIYGSCPMNGICV